MQPPPSASRSTSTRSSMCYNRHSEYYIKGGDFYLQAENTLFRVHSHFFIRESLRFREMTSEVCLGTRPNMGSTDTTPIKLENVKPEELAAFVWVFYNQDFLTYSTSVENWLMILKFSHRFVFPKVKALALRELERTDGLTVVDRIVLYKKYNIDMEYLTPLFALLCSREAFLTREECNILGTDLTYIISSGRERVRALHHDCRNPSTQSVCGEDVKRTITDLLQQTADDRSGGWSPRTGFKPARPRAVSTAGPQVVAADAATQPGTHLAKEDLHVPKTGPLPNPRRKRTLSLTLFLTDIKVTTERFRCFK